MSSNGGILVVLTIRVTLTNSALIKHANVLFDQCPVLSSSTFPGPGAPAAARLRDRRLLRWRRGLIPVQRVRPEKGAKEAKSTRVQLKQDKAGAARLEASRTVGGARLSCGSQSSNAAELLGL